MAKVHPNAPSPSPSPSPSPAVNKTEAVMTVWRKSLLFNCKGFTVFDSAGNLVFRVDNYSSSSKREILLMDATGAPLFTIRKKRLSLGESWLIYDGEERANPLFSAAKHASVRHSKGLAHVTPCSRGGTGTGSLHCYTVEGSYSQRCCTVYDERRQTVAEVRRKEAAHGVSLGGDVFRLSVEPGFDSSLAMAIVVLLDQMFGS